MGSTALPTTIDQYIAGFPSKVQALLKKVRKAMRAAAPGATEKISYRIPTFEQHGALIYFAGFRDHIGVYPRTAGMEKYRKEFERYASGKGTFRFPLDESLPLELIAKLVQVRVEENRLRALAKKPRSKKPRPKKAAAAKGSTGAKKVSATRKAGTRRPAKKKAPKR
jgi:uncharacterized protein YdhG (YjbR/CyaY superfamily)